MRKSWKSKRKEIEKVLKKELKIFFKKKKKKNLEEEILKRKMPWKVLFSKRRIVCFSKKKKKKVFKTKNALLLKRKIKWFQKEELFAFKKKMFSKEK